MHVGVPKEIKNHVYRVGMTPTSVREMVAHGHKVTVESNCGAGIGSSDDDYRSAEIIEKYWEHFGRATNSEFSTADALEHHVLTADLVIGAVLIPGASAPKLITGDMIRKMKPGAVFVDVAIDQGGCRETSCATTHADPTYIVDDVVHYCVANMPGGVPRTSTYALNNVTLPHMLALADKGYKQALLDDPHLLAGLNVCKRHVSYKEVADTLGYTYMDPESALKL